MSSDCGGKAENIQPAGGHDKLKLYRVTDILTCFLDLPVPASLEEMEPHDRKARISPNVSAQVRTGNGATHTRR